jgi:hypothetical protein
MCIKCECKLCAKVRTNIEQFQWYHLSRLDTTQWQVGSSGELSSIYPNHKSQKSIKIIGKPDNCVWASCGSWLYDSYHGEHYPKTPDLELYHPTLFKLFKLIPKTTANILRIKNVQELETFYLKYKHKSKQAPDWTKVSADYSAITIEFCKTYCMVPIRDIPTHDKSFNMLGFHLGWDVESLVVFNTDHFEYLVVEEMF